MRQPGTMRGGVRRRLLAACSAGLILLALAGAVAVSVGGLADSPALLRDRIARAIEQRTGQPTTIGSVRLSLVPWPGLEVRDLSAGSLLRLHRASARLELWPLLHHRLQLERVRIEPASLDLRRGADGQANWRSATAPARRGSPAGAAGHAGRWTLGLGDVRATGLAVSWHDAVTGTEAATTIRQLELRTCGDGLQATLNAGDTTISRASGPLARARDLRLSAWLGVAGGPVLRSLHVDATDTTLGTGRAGGRGLELGAWSLASGDRSAPLRLAAAGAWGGRPVRLDGTLGSIEALEHWGSGSRSPVTLSLAALVAGSTWHLEGQAGPASLDMAVHGSSADPRALWRHLPDLGRTGLSLRLRSDLASYADISDLRLASEAGDLAGVARLASGVRPMLTADLEAGRIDAGRLLRRPAAATLPPASPSRGAAQAPEPTSPPVPAPAGPKPAAWWRDLDATLSLRAGEVRLDGLSWPDLVALAGLKDGRLEVSAQDASKQQAQFRADLSAPAATLAVHPLLLPAPVLARLLGAPLPVQGTVELVGDIAVSGADRKAWRDTASGPLGASLVDGTIANRALRGLTGHQAALQALLPPDGSTALRCLALHAALGGGRAVVDTLALQAGPLEIGGKGTVFMNGRLDLALLADAGIGGASLSLPVHLDGTLDDPSAGLGVPPGQNDASRGARYGLAIGGGSDPDALCADALGRARQGLAGAMPAAATRRRLPRPVDILRGLGLVR